MSFESRTPYIVVGLGYGDESKGATVDALAAHLPDTAAVVRWSGGAQAAHNVIHGPRHHTFRQFGSASFLDVPTHFSRDMMVNPNMLLAEAETLASKGVRDPLSLLSVDTTSLITTPIHVALSRARELLRGGEAHGSCGLGIGDTTAYDLACLRVNRGAKRIGNFDLPSRVDSDALPVTAGIVANRTALITHLDKLARYATPMLEQVDDPDGLLAFGSVEEMAYAMRDVMGEVRLLAPDQGIVDALSQGSVIFEGSQGILLDQDYGFHPHTTWSQTTPRYLRRRLQAWGYTPFVLGLTRSYGTRHGAGPMPGEDTSQSVPELHNSTDRFQGHWRQGRLDLTLLRYAFFAAGGLDGVSISHLDAEVPDVIRWEAADEVKLHLTLSFSRGQVERVGEERANVARHARVHREFIHDGDAGLIELVEQATGAPVVLTADGPTRKDRTFR